MSFFGDLTPLRGKQRERLVGINQAMGLAPRGQLCAAVLKWIL
jgi:hypothetical protein